MFKFPKESFFRLLLAVQVKTNQTGSSIQNGAAMVSEDQSPLQRTDDIVFQSVSCLKKFKSRFVYSQLIQESLISL